MKKFIFVLFLIIPTTLLFSNDTYLNGTGGSLKNIAIQDTISIRTELIEIELFKSNYKITVRYDFYNDDKQKTILTGFPEYYYGRQNPTRIENFKMWYGDGREIVVTKEIANEIIGNYLNIISWYTKNITFNGHKTTTIRLVYEAAYGVYGFSSFVDYLIGTGKTWLGKIGKLNIRIINNSDYWIDMVRISNAIYDYKYISDGVYELELQDFEPNIDDQLLITVISSPSWFSPMWDISNGEFIFKDKVIDKTFLRFYSLNQLRLLRNSIYAYRGYNFASPDLNKYFNGFDWYKINIKFSDELFSFNELRNIKTIREVEESIKNPKNM